MRATTAAVPIAAGSVRIASRSSATAGYFAAFVALGLTTGLLGPTLPGLASQTSASLNAISYLFTARSLGYVLGATSGDGLYVRPDGIRVLGGASLLVGGVS